MISVKNVGKCYRVYENQRARLRNAIVPSNTKGTSEIWALRDINFDVKRGQSLAIIGRNGAGKSTLLEIITRTLTPTTGDIQIKGRVAALLELGSGFNPEYTGRENVFLNGLLLGLTRSEIEDRFDEIASFADIGDVLDRPVKSYSSGMLMRLAFAVQVALDPEVLIVDEALSVGDYFFQQKCFARLQQMREKGLTLLFVSHDMGTVRDICTHALYIRGGVLAYHGESSEAIRLYFRDGKPEVTAPIQVPPTQNFLPLDPATIDKVCRDAIWSRSPSSIQRLISVHVMDSSGKHVTGITLGKKMLVRAYLRLAGTDRPLMVGLTLKNKYDQIIFSTTNFSLNVQLIDGKDSAIAVFEFSIEMTVEGGQYSLRIVCGDPASATNARDASEWIGPLSVNWNYGVEQPPFMGMFGLPTSAHSSFLDKDFSL